MRDVERMAKGLSPKRLRITSALGLLLLLCSNPSVPNDQIGLELNRYSDNFGLDVLYPALSIQKQLSPETVLSARYVVDAITSASMKSRVEIDGITSATQLVHGGSTGTFDEVRQEIGLGLSRSGRLQKVSGNVLYSHEHDYRSLTLAARATRSFALDNSEISLSALRSWDEVFPVTRTWTREKNSSELSLGWTQVLTRRSIVQATFTHTATTGFLSSPYQVVTIIDEDNLQTQQIATRHPDRRDRNALRIALKQKVGNENALDIQYRRYWDSWSVDAHDAEIDFTRRFGGVPLGLSVRRYTQSRADFYRPQYERVEIYRTVDLRLDSGHSTQVEIHAAVPATILGGLGLVGGERLDLEGSLLYYRRVTSTRDWHRRSDTLVSVVTHLGVRYRF